MSKLYPNLVSALVPGALTVLQVHSVLKELLEEGIPIRDRQTIAELLLRCSDHSDDLETLVAEVRIGLSHYIHQDLFSEPTQIQIIALDQKFESALLEVTKSPKPVPVLSDSEPENRLREAIQKSSKKIAEKGQECVLLVAAELRFWMERFAKRVAPQVHVLPLMEFPKNYNISISETVGAVEK